MITRRALRSALAGVCLQALTVLASGPAFAADVPQSQPVATDQARVWFLRAFDPTLSLDTETIFCEWNTRRRKPAGYRPSGEPHVGYLHVHGV
jgi:hypothetical protein